MFFADESLTADSIQALKKILGSYSDEKLSDVKELIVSSTELLTFKQVKGLVEKTGLTALAEDLEDKLKKCMLHKYTM